MNRRGALAGVPARLDRRGRFVVGRRATAVASGRYPRAIEGARRPRTDTSEAPHERSWQNRNAGRAMNRRARLRHRAGQRGRRRGGAGLRRRRRIARKPRITLGRLCGSSTATRCGLTRAPTCQASWPRSLCACAGLTPRRRAAARAAIASGRGGKPQPRSRLRLSPARAPSSFATRNGGSGRAASSPTCCSTDALSPRRCWRPDTRTHTTAASAQAGANNDGARAAAP